MFVCHIYSARASISLEKPTHLQKNRQLELLSSHRPESLRKSSLLSRGTVFAESSLFHRFFYVFLLFFNVLLRCREAIGCLTNRQQPMMLVYGPLLYRLKPSFQANPRCAETFRRTDISLARKSRRCRAPRSISGIIEIDQASHPATWRNTSPLRWPVC